MRPLDALIDVIDWIAKAAAIVLVLGILGIMTSQIYFRYVLNSSLQWSEELSIWLMIWAVFVGSVVVIRNWEHVFIPTAVRALPMTIRPYVIIGSKIATLVFLVAIVVLGIGVFNGPANAFSHNIGVSTKWAKLSVPVGGGLMIVMVVGQILQDIRRLITGDLDAFRAYGKLEVE